MCRPCHGVKIITIVEHQRGPSVTAKRRIYSDASRAPADIPLAGVKEKRELKSFTRRGNLWLTDGGVPEGAETSVQRRRSRLLSIEGTEAISLYSDIFSSLFIRTHRLSGMLGYANRSSFASSSEVSLTRRRILATLRGGESSTLSESDSATFDAVGLLLYFLGSST